MCLHELCLKACRLKLCSLKDIANLVKWTGSTLLSTSEDHDRKTYCLSNTGFKDDWIILTLTS